MEEQTTDQLKEKIKQLEEKLAQAEQYKPLACVEVKATGLTSNPDGSYCVQIGTEKIRYVFDLQLSNIKIAQEFKIGQKLKLNLCNLPEPKLSCL